MDPDEAALSELISRARQRGSVSMEDLREALPIDGMTTQDISHVLARLDEAGFDLDIDPALLLPENKMVPENVIPIAKHEQTGSPETIPERGERAELFGSGSRANPENHAKPRSGSATSAPMLPWVFAFAIVVLAVFAAFAFR